MEYEKYNKNIKLLKLFEIETEPESICLICQEDINKTPKWVIKCLKCKNSLFHFNCINQWWKNNKNCPLCRQEHKDKDKDYKFIHKDNINKKLIISNYLYSQ